MKVVVNKLLPPKGFTGVNLFGVLFVRKRYLPRLTERVFRHERIHTAQMVEMLFLFFYVAYFLEWIYWLIRSLFDKGIDPYRSISFEREAYVHEYDAEYLKRRKFFAAWRFHFHVDGVKN